MKRPNGEIGILVVCEDVTERHEAQRLLDEYQAQLKGLTVRLLLAEEAERRRIATGLHDEIGQALTLAQLRLADFAEGEASGPSDAALREVSELLDRVIRASRSLTFELSCPVLYELGLEAALTSLSQRFDRRNGLRCRFETDGRVGSVADEVGVVLYRATRELLRNVVKHAEAEHARISLEQDAGLIMISVEDDGVGFDAPDALRAFTKSGGFGLFSVREGLNHIGGNVDVTSTAGRGTRVVLSAPPGSMEQT